MWWLAEEITAGAVAKALAVEQPGTVRVTWSVDQPLHPVLQPAGEPATLTELTERLRQVPMVGLLRDGRVWARARWISEVEFFLPVVPPGSYTLVLHHAYERFLAVQSQLEVTSGNETAVALKIRRADHGGIALAYYDPTQNKYEPLHPRARVYDPNLILAIAPTSMLHRSETQGGLAQEYDVAEYGGLNLTGQYRLDFDTPRYRAVAGQALTVNRMPPHRPVAGAEKAVPVEDYKITVIRLQPLSAIGAKGPANKPPPARYELLPAPK